MDFRRWQVIMLLRQGFSGLLFLAMLSSEAGAATPRPSILGISHIAVYTSNPAATEHFYMFVVGAEKLPDPENHEGVRYALSPTQFIEVLPLPRTATSDSAVDHLDHTAWRTSDARAMRRYLAAKGWKTPRHVQQGSDGSRWFTVLDPEGNKVQFVQPPQHPAVVHAPNEVGRHIIHFGFLVHNRAAEDSFYRGLLGFRPYWAGGPKPGVIAYVSQQVPDGRDWLEYMLVDEPGPEIPADMTQRRLGSMDHFSIGETSVPDAFKILVAEQRLDCRHDAVPHIGPGDGKYQFNLYDPDGTRVELMNFQPTNKPNPPFTALSPTR
jgi:catechol 2,3-dioxygenase-like lactoylglutathione lyase family enzyme